MVASTVSARMVGRQAELAVLRDAFASSRAGKPVAVVVRGEAGIGKTRLLQEFLAELGRSGGSPPVVVAVGQCVDLGPIGAPFTPVRRMLHDLHLAVGDEALRAAAGSPTVVATLGTLLPELYDGGGALPQSGADYVAEAVERIVENLSQEHHLVLVLEDLHWADTATLSLLKTLAVTLRGAHVLLVATYRSDDVGRGHPLRPVLAELDRSRSVTALPVGRLSETEVAEQARLITDDLPAEALQAVVSRSEGVPFFVEELLGLEGAPMPDTLRDLVLARFERLGDAARQAVELLAVGGVRVDQDVLAQVRRDDADGLSAGLREAVASNVVVAEPDGYRFRHALIQEAVHDQLLPSERVELHQRYASVLQRRVDEGGAALAAAVAEHWLGARDLPRAFDATVTAHAHALSTHAPAAAAQLGERLLELWPQVPDAGARAGTTVHRLTAVVADSWHAVADMDRTLRVVRAGLAAAPEDPVERASLHRLAGIALGNQGRTSEGDEHLRQAVSLLEGSQDPAALPLLALSLNSLYLSASSEIDEAEREAGLARATSLAEASGDATVLAKTLIGRSSMLTDRGEFEQGLAVLERVASGGPEPEDRLHAYMVQVDVLVRLGRFAEAIRVGDEGVKVATDLGMERGLGSLVAANLGEALLAVGDATRGRATLHRARELLAAIPTFESFCVRLLALADSWDGRPDVGASTRQEEAPLIEMVTEDDPEEVIGWAEHDIEAALNLAESAADSDVRVQLVSDASTAGLALPVTQLEHNPGLSRRLLPGLSRSHAEASLLGLPQAVELEALIRRISADLAEEGPDPAHQALVEAEARRGSGQAPAPDAWRAALAATGEGLVAVRYRHYAAYRLAQALLSEDQRAEAAEVLARVIDEAPGQGVSTVAGWAADLAAQAGLARAGPRAATGQTGVESLTARERQVLQLVAEGLTNREIGGRLFISPKTASVHVSAILAKIGARGRAEAARMFSEHQAAGRS